MNTTPEFRQLRSFLAVAETLHFGRAATKLGMAQPNLSQQIARLESLIGYPLFVRHAKGVRLTPAGAFLRGKTEILLASLQGALEITRKFGSGDAGSLLVGFCGSVILTSVAGILRGFRSAYPDIALELKELHVNEQIGMLERDMLDACFVRDCGHPEQLTSLCLLDEPYVAVVSQHHHLASRRKVDPALLKDEPFILFSPEMAQGAYEKTLDLCAAHGFRPNVQREAAQWTSLATLIGAGLGISIAPACVATVLVPDVCCIPLTSKHRTRVEIAFRDSTGNPSVARLVEYARKFQA